MEDIKNRQSSNMVEIFINFLSFLLLAIIATAVGILYFQVINKYFPDILSGTYQNYQFSSFNSSAIHYSIASLIIGFPIYLWALWFWFSAFGPLRQSSSPRLRRVGAGSEASGSAESGKNPISKEESKLSKWITYIVLLIAGGTIIGDLITVLYNFLQGEFGVRFLLKAISILIIAVFIFVFYFLERKKIQYKKEISPVIFWILTALSSIIIILAIVFGFIVGGTPFEARIRKFDLERVNNLQSLSSCVSAFAYDNERLPENTNELKSNARYSYCASIIDPETKKDYEYKVVSKSEFELCAEFNLSTLEDFQNLGYYGGFVKHSQGRSCEKQTVTLKKPIPFEKTIPVPSR
ncbi:MAG: DUF5671 domain-containing protein [Patescibacteria group bacterium]